MLAGATLEDTREYNNKVTFETIRSNEPISRKEISELTGLTPATISNITNELIKNGLVLETGRRKGLRGQPAIELEINPDGGFALGFELGRHCLYGVTVNLSGEMLSESYEDWNFPTPESASKILTKHSRRLIKDSGIKDDMILGIGVAMPGPFLGNNKQIVSPIKFPKWHHFPIQEHLTNSLGFPVIMENDAMASAISEKYYGYGREHKSFYYIYLGSGIGGAMILNRQPYEGYSPNTGELGWITYNVNHKPCPIGHFLGLDALYYFLNQHSIDVSTVAELSELYEQQNIHLWEWMNEAAECLNVAINSINSILGPEAILIGGHFPAAIIEHLLKLLEIKTTATQMAQPDRFIIDQAVIRYSLSGKLSSALGAATLPLFQLFGQQTLAYNLKG